METYRPDTDARLAGLSNERLDMYRAAYALSRLARLSKLSFFLKGVAGREYEPWRTFILSFLEGADTNLVEYAHKPSTFRKDDFTVVPLVSTKEASYRGRYGTRYACIMTSEKRLDVPVYADAPFTYSLLYRKPPERWLPAPSESEAVWTPISTVGFFPDFKKKRILVDQVQGCDVDPLRRHKEKNRARMKFSKQPEEILFEMVCKVGKEAGFDSVGLRKSTRNHWFVVSEAKKETVYDRVAASKGLTKGSPLSAYSMAPIEKI